MPNMMNIVLSLNSQYLMPSVVCIISILENNKQPINFFILHSQLEEKEIDFIKKIVKQYSRNSLVEAIKIEEGKFEQCPINGRAKEAYYKLLIPWVLPKNLERCLYLDGDTLVNKPLDEYYNFDFENKALIVSEDIGEILFYYKEMHPLLGIPLEFRYFNSGVLLFNLDYFRKNINFEDILNYIKSKHQYLKFLDQDVFNGLFYGQVKMVASRLYNYQEILVNNLITNNNMRDALIVHFLQKPWKYTYNGVNANYWWRYGKKVYKTEYAFFRIKNLIYNTLLKIGLLFFSINFIKKFNK